MTPGSSRPTDLEPGLRILGDMIIAVATKRRLAVDLAPDQPSPPFSGLGRSALSSSSVDRPAHPLLTERPRNLRPGLSMSGSRVRVGTKSR